MLSAFLHSVTTPSKKQLLSWDLAPTVSEWSRQMRGDDPVLVALTGLVQHAFLLSEALAPGPRLWWTSLHSLSLHNSRFCLSVIEPPALCPEMSQGKINIVASVLLTPHYPALNTSWPRGQLLLYPLCFLFQREDDP